MANSSSNEWTSSKSISKLICSRCAILVRICLYLKTLFAALSSITANSKKKVFSCSEIHLLNLQFNGLALSKLLVSSWLCKQPLLHEEFCANVEKKLTLVLNVISCYFIRHFSRVLIDVAPLEIRLKFA